MMRLMFYGMLGALTQMAVPAGALTGAGAAILLSVLLVEIVLNNGGQGAGGK